MNLTELLDQTAGKWPEKTTLIEGDTSVSYAELVGKINVLAAQLRALICLPAAASDFAFPTASATSR